MPNQDVGLEAYSSRLDYWQASEGEPGRRAERAGKEQAAPEGAQAGWRAGRGGFLDLDGCLRRTGWRWARRMTAPTGRPGAFPRGRGGRVGVPIWAIMRPITRRTCRGVTGRRADSQGGRGWLASGRA